MSDGTIDWAARKQRARDYLKVRKVAQKPYMDYDRGVVGVWWPDATTYEYDTDGASAEGQRAWRKEKGR